jgi:hypothetical protein
MTKKCAAAYEAICNSLCTSPTFANAARTVGISEATLWRWVGLSQAGSEEMIFSWMGDVAPLHVHMKAATRAAAATVVQNLMHRAIHGDTTQSMYKGQPQWQLDPKLLSWTSEELSALGLDPYARDEKGNLIPVLITTPPPVALALAAAAAFYPKTWGNNSQVVVENRNSGVTVVEHRYGNKPKALPVPVQVLAPPVDTGDDDDLTDLLGPAPDRGEEPVVESTDDDAQRDQAPAAAPPPQATVVDPRYGALNAEQLGMLAKLRATSTVSISAPTQPGAIVERFSVTDADDTNPRRVGPGEIPKGGMKMV